MDFDYKNILIMGYGKSGKAVEEIVKNLNVNYTIYDSYKKVDGGGYSSKLSKKFIEKFDLIVLSPGISIFNKYIVYAEKIGIKVVGEMEFGYWFTDSPVVAITGTNGKTTTTSLINSMVSKKFKSDAFGNIGNPLSNAYGKDIDYLVCEVSSFQLESTYSFKPYISVILNIAPDHLDRHKTYENYINCKLGLLKNCNEKSLVVLNADDELLMKRTENINAKKYYISKTKSVKGVYIKGDKVYVNVTSNTPFMDISALNKYYGLIDDVLASILVASLLKLDKEDILNSLNEFELAPHRLELVAKENGVTYVDDSKSTNVHSTSNALNVVDNGVVLLLGGVDKKLNFEEIFERYSEKIYHVVAFGSARKKILKTAKKLNFEKISSAKTMYEATKIACEIAKEGNTVLLSPGCASFDEFNNYAERGDKFVSILKELGNVKY